LGAKKYFVLMKNGKDTAQVFASRQPRGAALKAATRGATDIHLRERGTNRIHVFRGWTTMVKPPASAPAWLKKAGFIKKANVKKQRVEYVGGKRRTSSTPKSDFDKSDFDKSDFDKSDFDKSD
jgi:hypothetical protein